LAPHQWLQQRRIDKAKQLLRADTMALAEVAAACGFADQSHFTRVFTRTLGIGPGHWRRAHRD
jgi:AraC family transcriptional regulator